MPASAVCLLLLVVSCSASFSDDMQIYEDECTSEEVYPCLKGGCVPLDKLCDGEIDCEDGSDEEFCMDSELTPGFCNATHQFMCADKKRCIATSWVCNNQNDCDDLSDELNCTSEPEVKPGCSGFLCDEKRCISKLWVCDGVYDCDDKTDESLDVCRHSQMSHAIIDGQFCEELEWPEERSYRCSDASFCVPIKLMCNGLADCRDGSDEGIFCKKWTTMCNSLKCRDKAFCVPDRSGPSCVCRRSDSERFYNETTQRCEEIDLCKTLQPHCSQKCEANLCSCDKGYTASDNYCYATGLEPQLFFSTGNEIRFIFLKTKREHLVATGMKKAHGVTFDGKYLYWVETAQGHQAIMRAELENVTQTKQVLVSIGIDEPGDIAIDWLGGHFYFGDTKRGVITACHLDGRLCTTVVTKSKHPRFITLDVREGKMYWADYMEGSVIMAANMDGSNAAVLVSGLAQFASGVAVDSPNRRLYYIDSTIHVFKLDDRKSYPLFNERFHQPYGVAIFENTVYWGDWTSNTVQATSKIPNPGQRRSVLLHVDTPVFGLNVYHPLLNNTEHNPCARHKCSHFCLVSSNDSYTCACPDDMMLVNNATCSEIPDYRPQFLLVASGAYFTKIQYNSLGNPETHVTKFNVGYIQSFTYANKRDTIYMFDRLDQTLRHIHMNDFPYGNTTVLEFPIYARSIIDMDYDYVTDNLYLLDKNLGSIWVYSPRIRDGFHLRLYFEYNPCSLTVLPEHGMLLMAGATNHDDEVHLHHLDLDGSDPHVITMHRLKGRVVIRYAHGTDTVYLAEENEGVIDVMDPEGHGRETFRELPTAVASMAVTDTFIFWTDRRTRRLYWTDVHDAGRHKIRRMELPSFPNGTQLHLVATTPLPSHNDPLLTHPCSANPCDHLCVQSRNSSTGYQCICAQGFRVRNNSCVPDLHCLPGEYRCVKSDVCLERNKVCDGVKDCEHGEDEMTCERVKPQPKCPPGKYYCVSKCIDNNQHCQYRVICNDFHCGPGYSQEFCIDRSQLCDKVKDCPNGVDESPMVCDNITCTDDEFMCDSKSCVKRTFRCDAEADCLDGSDELNCNYKCQPGMFQCKTGTCIPVVKRCNFQNDCIDGSDEMDCGEDEFVTEPPQTVCPPWEFACEKNVSICLPLTARCNTKVECPGGTDELGCEFRCGGGMYQCEHEPRCVPRRMLCDGRRHCADGSDETAKACVMVNKTFSWETHRAPVVCDGYQCAEGECVDWEQSCDGIKDCADGADEGGLCSSACKNATCPYLCQPTSVGPHCYCPEGYRARGNSCADIDECAEDQCSQVCVNLKGSFMCSCYHGYALRADRRSCKAVKGNLSILYVTGNSVWSLAGDGTAAVKYNDPLIPRITDMDYIISKKKLYVTSSLPPKLVEVDSAGQEITVTRIGAPSRVAVDWITGNVYFVEHTVAVSYLRVCDFVKKKCARLQRLSSNAEITSLIVDPSAALMFYCITKDMESVVWKATMAGRETTDLATVTNCTGLAVDSFRQRLYVAETGPAHIIAMSYEGERTKKVLTHDPHLQNPHGLQIFEDHIYFRVANSFKLSRCVLFGQKICEPYIYKMFSANSFVISHESVQRDDVMNICEGFTCNSVCVLATDEPVCVCGDGSLAKNGVCDASTITLQPLFNGWSGQDHMYAHNVMYTIVVCVFVLVVLFSLLYIYYRIYLPAVARRAPYMEVRFQNRSAPETPEGEIPSSSTVEFPEFAALDRAPLEFTNPLDYMRNVWRRSFRRNRPVGTASLEINVPPPAQQDESDTESECDTRESRQIIN